MFLRFPFLQGPLRKPSRKFRSRSNFDTFQEATVTEVIYPHQAGRVRLNGTCWYARCEREIILIPDQFVYVVGHRNITLLVEPFHCVLQEE